MNKYTLHITASGPGVSFTAVAEAEGANLGEAMDQMEELQTEDVSREQVEQCTEITMRIIKVPTARKRPRRRT